MNVYDHAMRAAQETLDRTGRRAIAGIAATAYAARVRDGYVLMGTWFEHIPTVTEIEVWRRGPTGDDKLWADSISQTDMASNYSLLSGFGGGHPVAVYQWTVSIAADQSPDAFHGLESLPADTHLFVRLIRARPEYYPFEADLVMTGDRPQVSDDGAPKRHRNDTFDDEQP